MLHVLDWSSNSIFFLLIFYICSFALLSGEFPQKSSFLLLYFNFQECFLEHLFFIDMSYLSEDINDSFLKFSSAAQSVVSKLLWFFVSPSSFIRGFPHMSLNFLLVAYI